MSLNALMAKADIDATSKEELQLQLEDKKVQVETLRKELANLEKDRKKKIDKIFIDDLSCLLNEKGFQFTTKDSNYIYSYRNVLQIKVELNDESRSIKVIQNDKETKNVTMVYKFDYQIKPRIGGEPKINPTEKEILIDQINDLDRTISRIEANIKSINSATYVIRLESDSRDYKNAYELIAAIE